MALEVPILASSPSLMPRKPKGLPHGTPPPRAVGTCDKESAKVTTKLKYWLEQPLTPIHTCAHEHTRAHTRTHTRTHTLQEGEEPGLIRSPPAAGAALALMYFKDCLGGWGRGGAGEVPASGWWS